MTEREFFQRTLGLCEPWEIVDVKLDVEAKEVEVEVAVKKGTKWAEDGELLPIVDYTPRCWRHLDTMQLKTTIVARVPRVRYPDGKTAVVPVPWAEKGSRWTLDFEALAVEVLKASASTAAAAALLRLGWGSTNAIMKRSVERGLGRRETGEIANLGLDDKSFRKRHRYGTLVNDLDRGRVLEVVESRTEEAALSALDSLGEEVLGGVKAVAIDMSRALENAVRARCPQAAVVYDRYHVSALLGAAVDKVRRGEDKALRAGGDDTLKGTRFLWLSGLENMATHHLATFLDLAQRALKTARAWEHRFLFTSFWEQPSAGKAAAFFKKWYGRAVRCRLKPVADAARTLKRHLPGLLAYFEHPITNAMSEGINSRVEAIKNSARGFHSFDTFRTRILFHLGGLDLKPRYS